ncbi:argininosuccinate lyase [Verrucomicrobia bacterium]|jgi:argininosuccinate lyase|nr:argininosuccinate lyase [Verrucomicrobiota bacterium]MDA7866972.1 argininosuccinate lyase [Verrucomicrobiota bacterium]MDB4798588.1 argininosuccinate lyase [Verrucomicrobiota bacterium]
MKKVSQVSRSGRFNQTAAQELVDFTESISFDWRLWRQDIIGSMAHARMLHKIGVLTKAELSEILSGLESIGDEIDQGQFEWKPELEDVHMNIESALTEKAPAGAKLHTSRSRNDQVALDMRMWLRDDIIDVIDEIKSLQSALVALGKRSFPTPIPGYTHLQRAQPVPFAHHLLAYVEMLNRDAERFSDAFDRVNVCPLGSGALAGSTIRLNREMVAKELGFVSSKGEPRITQNSMDAVSDRDFVVEFMSAAALTAVHLSRLSEDLILWASAEFNFVKIADAYTTGSSLMPQKKNPDLAELTRGKSGRVIGNLVSLLTLLKGLPMTYNRDLQEDKERLFDGSDTLHGCLRIMAAMISHTNIVEEECQKAAKDSMLLATDLADYLVNINVPFRDAHHIVGDVVGLAENKGVALDQLTLRDLKSVDSRFKRDALAVFSLDRALEERRTTGSPGLKEVKKQLRIWQSRLKDERQ